MHAGSIKSRKSMRVATIFTGVAACTAGMAQVANAQDVAHAAVKPASKHVGRTIHPAAVPANQGSIRHASACGYRGVDPTWLHVSTNFLLGESRGGSPNYTYITSVCFGYKGAYSSPPGIGINAECGGNNHGWLGGVNGGASVFASFKAGTTYRDLYWSHLLAVDISGWGGTDKCPEAPYYGEGLG
jgi:hypothetical protein